MGANLCDTLQALPYITILCFRHQVLHDQCSTDPKSSLVSFHNVITKKKKFSFSFFFCLLHIDFLKFLILLSSLLLFICSSSLVSCIDLIKGSVRCNGFCLTQLNRAMRKEFFSMVSFFLLEPLVLLNQNYFFCDV